MKKLLFAYSLLPLVWVITFMVFAYYDYRPHGIVDSLVNYVGFFYFYYGLGFIIWMVFLIIMKVKKKISILEMLVNIALVVIAVCVAIYCYNHDVFCVRSCYID